ncbi:hypothetical protein BDZ89DRAFT_1060750 [Hymenopellis radicata]|nr:hypothetical protein BDZ89DRAFT_1060750 [Hymenopellis radicata]
MYFNVVDPDDATIVAPTTASVTSVANDVAFLDAECVMELRAYISEGKNRIQSNKPIISPTLTPPQTPITSHPPTLARARRPLLSPVPDNETSTVNPRRAYRTPMETRRRLGWIVDDPQPKRRFKLTPMNRASVRTVMSSSSSSPEDLGDMLAMLSILMLINFCGPCCFVYAGLRVVFIAISRRSAV